MRIQGGLTLVDGQLAEAGVRVDEAAGVIDAVGAEGGNGRCFDARGLYVLPGIVDIHGDAFERQLMPRPGVGFPIDVALVDSDRQAVANGITTIFHGVTWSWEPGLRGADNARGMVEAIQALRPTLGADTHCHLRFETFNLDAETEVTEWLMRRRIGLLGFNDHMPGGNTPPRTRKVAQMAERAGLSSEDFNALVARLREQAPPGALIGHLGSGRFVLALPWQARVGEADADAQHQLALRRLAAAVQAALKQPVRLGSVSVCPQGLIGAARGPADGRHGEALLKAAKMALQAVQGAEGVRLFEPALQAQALQALQREAALRDALALGELSLVYQPQVSLATGRVSGVEALLRWQSPQLGAVPPDQFVPLAEQSGLIAPIGDWVIREACAQAQRWRAAGLPAIRMSVNISPVQFQLGDVAQTIVQALADSGLPPSQFGIEVTESALQHDHAHVAATLHSLRALGIEIALDDFGTGYSSLSRLRELPINLLKVDRSFVSDVTAAPQSASMTRSIITLAHGLQMPVLAEGVETEGQLAMLVANGCDSIQGYLFSRPLAPEALAELLRSGRGLDGHLQPAPPRQRTLLLVDDEQHILSALRRLFRADGYTVLCASSGGQALELLATHAVDVILSDQRMPGMTGVEFLRRARALHPAAVRITLSGFTDLQSIIDAVNEGAVYKFLTKPWDDARLRAHVAEAFARKELADDNQRLQGELAALTAQRRLR